MSLSINKEQKDQAVSVIYKSIIGFIPGNHIIDAFVEYRGAVQQSRLNKFSEYLKEGFENITGKSFDPENLKSEEFIDAFDVIIRKVAATSSEEKLKRYSNILLGVMYEKNEAEMFFKFVNLVEELSETQILIISCLSKHKKLSEQRIMQWLANPEAYSNHLLNFIDKDAFKLFNGQIISEYEITFFINELRSTGIITITPGSSSKSTGIFKTPDTYKLSPIGVRFLDFIKEYGK